MARITAKQRRRAGREAQAMATEADIARAISGASDTEAAQILQGAGINQTSTTSPVVVEEPVVDAPQMPRGVAGAEWKPTPGGGFELQVQGMNVKDWNKGVAAGNIKVEGGKTVVSPAGPSSLFDKNAFEIVKGLLRQYNLEGLESVVYEWMDRGIGDDAATAMLRETGAYKERFYGNELRRLAGKNMLDEGTYLTLENDYLEWANYYGITGYFGTDPKQRRSKFATLIGNDINVPEFKERIDTAITRVQRADPSVKNALRDFYNIGDNDLVGYFLDPKENLKILQEKVTAAEIGGAAIGQGLTSSRMRAEELARLGIDRAEAVRGYSEIAQDLPTAQKLSQIYSEEGIDYTQRTGEEEEFQKLASARRAKERLKVREASEFAGSTRGVLGGGAAGLI